MPVAALQHPGRAREEGRADARPVHEIGGMLDREEIARRGFDPAVVSRVLHMVQRSEYKRRQATYLR